MNSHSFTIKPDTSEPLQRGTRVVLHLKEDAQELADPVRLAKLIKQYSQFISFPIKLYSSRKEPKKVLDEEATKRKQEAEDKKAQVRHAAQHTLGVDCGLSGNLLSEGAGGTAG